MPLATSRRPVGPAVALVEDVPLPLQLRRGTDPTAFGVAAREDLDGTHSPSRPQAAA